MPLSVKKDETPNPIAINLLGSNAVVLEPDRVPDSVQQFRIARRGLGDSFTSPC